MAPPLRVVLGLQVEVPPGLDTDALGTFTREIPRAGTMHQAARAKVELGFRQHGARLGIASEGAFGPHPHVPIGHAGTELLLFVDRDLEIEVCESELDEAPAYDGGTVETLDALDALLARIDFPRHALAMVPLDPQAAFEPRKGLRDHHSLRDAFECARRVSRNGEVWVEIDMRAHMNPTRMAAIQRVAQRLAKRLATLCPSCGTPGFGRVEVAMGLPCASCGTPSTLALGEVHGCARCAHRSKLPRVDGLRYAEPRWCPSCNP